MVDLLKLLGFLFLVFSSLGGIIIMKDSGWNWPTMAYGIALIMQGLFSFAVSFVLGNTFSKTEKILSKIEYKYKEDGIEDDKSVKPTKEIEVEEEGKERWRKYL